MDDDYKYVTGYKADERTQFSLHIEKRKWNYLLLEI